MGRFIRNCLLCVSDDKTHSFYHLFLRQKSNRIITGGDFMKQQYMRFYIQNHIAFNVK